MAFFGVKLGGEDVVAADNAGKGFGVMALTECDAGVLWHEVVAVDEVKMAVLWDVGKQGVGAGLVDGVPAHVWDFEAATICGLLAIGKAADAACKPV